ncbi:unnamed protein product [marine sediment metagenome]|uniref:Uncharacterized protein n=1 Tax=marine sediment metagenome TaxID=412755 RepID=X1EY73_9ZZZZ
MEDGRIIDVIVEDYIDEHNCKVWADPGLKELILSVEGVSNIYLNNCNTCYAVFLDHRYDKELVAKEIIATIKCRKF